MKIIGSGAATTIVDGGGVGTVFTTPVATIHVTLAKLTIRNGSSYYGGGINNSATLTIYKSTISGNVATGNQAAGGGIYNNGKLAIYTSTISGNVGTDFPQYTQGGGVFNSGAMSITESIISRNGASYQGGGICNVYGWLTITNSTVSENSAGGGWGGGINNGDPYNGTMTITSSTITGNSAGYGGGIDNRGTLTITSSTISWNGVADWHVGNIDGTAILQNSIVSNPIGGGNCNSAMTSNGYNLSSDNSCNFSGPGDMNRTQPRLAKLGNYGGPTQTMPLLSGSPAIDAGNPNGCTDGNGNLLKTDQRGAPRPDPEDSGGCDIGAYERQRD